MAYLLDKWLIDAKKFLLYDCRTDKQSTINCLLEYCVRGCNVWQTKLNFFDLPRAYS